MEEEEGDRFDRIAISSGEMKGGVVVGVFWGGEGEGGGVARKEQGDRGGVARRCSVVDGGIAGFGIGKGEDLGLGGFILA